MEVAVEDDEERGGTETHVLRQHPIYGDIFPPRCDDNDEWQGFKLTQISKIAIQSKPSYPIAL